MARKFSRHVACGVFTVAWQWAAAPIVLTLCLAAAAADLVVTQRGSVAFYMDAVIVAATSATLLLVLWFAAYKMALVCLAPEPLAEPLVVEPLVVGPPPLVTEPLAMPTTAPQLSPQHYIRVPQQRLLV